MSDLAAAAAAFLGLILSHAAAVRLEMARPTLRLVAALAGLWLGTAAAAMAALRWLCPPAAPMPLTAAGLYLMLALWYWGQCNVLANRSPSLTILDFIDRRGRATRAELAAVLTDETLIAGRLRGIAAEGYLAADGEAWRITPRGRRVARFILAYRRVLGLGIGG